MNRRPAPIVVGFPSATDALMKPVAATEVAEIATPKAKQNATSQAPRPKQPLPAPAADVRKVTARVDADLLGRCRAAFMAERLQRGSKAPASFEEWVSHALAEKLARAEKKNGQPFPALDSLTRGRSSTN